MSLLAKLNVFGAKVDAQESKLAELTTQVAELKSAHEQATEALESKESELSDLSAKVTALETEKASLQAKVEASETKITELSNTIKDPKGEIAKQAAIIAVEQVAGAGVPADTAAGIATETVTTSEKIKGLTGLERYMAAEAARKNQTVTK